MIKKLMITTSLIAMCSVASASQFMVGLNGGSASFDTGYDSAQEYGVHAIFASRAGAAIEASLSYFEAESEGSGSDLKALPVLAGMSYTFGKGAIVPYAGIAGGLAFLSGAYNESAITYGAKAGLSFSVTPDFRLFVEGRKLYINADSKTIEPTTVSIGCSVIFGKSGPQGRKHPFVRERRKHHDAEYEPVDRRRQGRRKPRGRY